MSKKRGYATEGQTEVSIEQTICLFVWWFLLVFFDVFFLVYFELS